MPVTKEVVRVASGAVIFSNDEVGAKVLIVTSTKNKDRWVLPKGGVEPDLEPRENAAKETREEAGVAANLFDEVDRYECEGKEGWQLEIYYWGVFVSNVDWEEYAIRKKEWVSVNEAIARLGEDQQRVVSLAAIAHHNMCHPDFTANVIAEDGSIGRLHAD